MLLIIMNLGRPRSFRTLAFLSGSSAFPHAANGHINLTGDHSARRDCDQARLQCDVQPPDLPPSQYNLSIGLRWAVSLGIQDGGPC